MELRGWDDDLTWEEVRDMYQGKFDDEEDFARHIVEEVYFDKVNGLLGEYFDFERFALDLFISDYDFNDGHVFCTRI